MPIVLTAGRAGSTFLTEYIRLNFSIETYEFFNKDFFDSCIKQGSCGSVHEYLSYLSSQLSCDGLISVKVTPSLLSNMDWDQGLLNDCGIYNAIKSHKAKLLLLRLDPLAGALSTANALSSGMWHCIEDGAPESNSQVEYDHLSSPVSRQSILYSSLVDYLQSEIQFLDFCSGLNLEFYVLYEYLLGSPAIFCSQVHEWMVKSCLQVVPDGKSVIAPSVRPIPTHFKLFNNSSLAMLSDDQFAIVQDLVSARQVAVSDCLQRLRLAPVNLPVAMRYDA